MCEHWQRRKHSGQSDPTSHTIGAFHSVHVILLGCAEHADVIGANPFRISKLNGLNIVDTPGNPAEERPVKERQITQENYRYDVRFVSARTICVCAEISVKCAEIRGHAAPVSIGK
ncbi:hypothetical protein PCAR4_640021 [Paraburkholderia caribensis]|nr:hypothetical protein PCAR4_640021 [Paraburkholderia caribensis]